MVKKTIMMGVIIVMSLGIFIGCNDVSKYNASVLNEGYTFNPNFLKENRTLGARYINESWNEETDELSSKYLIDETSPEDRVFIIKQQSELDDIFDNFVQVNFEKEMVLIYCYTDIYNRQHIIDKIILEDNILEIKFSLKNPKSGIHDASMPESRWLIIKMNVIEVNTVKFAKK